MWHKRTGIIAALPAAAFNKNGNPRNVNDKCRTVHPRFKFYDFLHPSPLSRTMQSSLLALELQDMEAEQLLTKSQGMNNN